MSFRRAYAARADSDIRAGNRSESPALIEYPNKDSEHSITEGARCCFFRVADDELIRVAAVSEEAGMMKSAAHASWSRLDRLANEAFKRFVGLKPILVLRDSISSGVGMILKEVLFSLIERREWAVSRSVLSPVPSSLRRPAIFEKHIPNARRDLNKQALKSGTQGKIPLLNRSNEFRCLANQDTSFNRPSPSNATFASD